jgi:hypothetical protein
MPLRTAFAGIGAVLLLSSSASMAAEYRADEFLRLDLSKAVLSPKPLGPPAEFAPVAVEAKGETISDRCSEDDEEVVTAEPKAVPPLRQAAVSAHETPKRATHRRLAHRRGNPLDAQAMDTRIQVWPCRSGGICNWRQ